MVTLVKLRLSGLLVAMLGSSLTFAQSTQPVWNDTYPEKTEALSLKGDPVRGENAFVICQGCHRVGALGRVDGSYPRLAGQFPEYTDELKCWTRSENRWMRRAAAVSLIVPAKHGKFLPEALGIAELLLTDSDDLVQKGYGWLLKEASRKHTEEVFAFVMKNKKEMPRTALRYAIELMPKDLKAEAMKKDW